MNRLRTNFAIAAVWVWTSGLVADDATIEVPKPPRPPIPNVQEAVPPLSDANIDGMYDTLRSLQDERRGLVADFRAPREPDSGDASQGAADVAPPSIGHRDLFDMRRQVGERSSASYSRSVSVKRKLDRLKHLVEDGLFCQPSDAAPIEATAATPSVTLEAPAPPEAPDQVQDISPTVDRPDASLRSSGEASLAPVVTVPASQPTPTVIPDTVIEALSMVDGPVDQLAFANNLYGTGETGLALEIYQKLNKSKLVPDQVVWVEYQMANCHRLLGDKQAAERGYRIVTSRDKSSWVGSNARWWLEVADRTRRLKDRTDRIVVSLKELQDGNVTATTTR